MFNPFRRSSAPAGSGFVSVCFHPDRMDVARIGAGGKKPVVGVLESYERGTDDLEALKRLRKKFRLGAVACTTLLQPAEYQLLQIGTPPSTDPKKRDEDVRAKLADLIEAPLAHVTYDVLDIPTERMAPRRPLNSYVVVAGNAGIAPKVKLFHEAGIALKAIDIPELAQRNVARYCEQPDRALAFLTFAPDQGLLTFTCGGELFLSRRLDIGLADLQTDDVDARQRLFDRIALELQRSLDNFDRQYGFLPLSRLVLGPQPGSATLQGYLREYLGVTVDVLDLAQIFDFPAIPELHKGDRQTQCLLSLGAALREDVAA